MKKMNLFLTMVAMTGMLALTGCDVTVETGKTDIPLKAVNETVATQTSETVTTPAPTEAMVETAEDDFVAGVAETTETETTETETETVAEAPESTDWATALDHSKDWMFILSGEEELAYYFELTTDETDYLTYGTIVCKGNKGTDWEYKTGKHSLAQNYNVELVYETSERLYVNDGGSIVALDVRDGRELWRNNEYEGGGSSAIMDDNGNLYVAGYEYPALMGIDPNGKTLLYVEQFADYYWTRDIVLEDDFTLAIYYETMEGARVKMDLRDYSYTILE